MSTPQPPRRRRIAGEGRPTPATPDAVAPAGPRRPAAPPRVRTPRAPGVPSLDEPTGPTVRAPRRPLKSPKPTAAVGPSEAGDPGRAPGRSLNWRTVVAVVASVAVLAGGAYAAYAGYDRMTSSSLSAADADAAASAAATAAETIFTYRFDQLDQYQTDAVALMTSSYAKEFKAVSPALADIAPQRQVVVQSVVQQSAPVPCSRDCESDRVQVLVFLDQARLIAGQGEPTVFGNRITMTMVRDRGTWRVDDIRAL